MILNGGIIGQANQPIQYKASGIWSFAERATQLLYGNFPRYFRGWNITSLANRQSSFTASFDIQPQETLPTGIAFKDDGTKMYLVGTTGDDVNEYSLSTAWDITTASFVRTFSVVTNSADPSGIAFKSDGASMYIISATTDAVSEYSLSTAWNISTATHVRNISIAAKEVNPSGIAFKPDGTKMYITGTSSDSVHEYSLSTAWNISTAVFSVSFSAAAQTGTPIDLAFSSDGTKMFIPSSTAPEWIFQYELITAWDVSTSTYTGIRYSVISEDGAQGIFFSSDGLTMYTVGSAEDRVYQYTLKEPWNLETPGHLEAQTFSVTTQDTTPNGVTFKTDGTKMYIAGSATSKVYQYSLSTPWQISTASYDNISANAAVGATTYTPNEVIFKPDGTSMYICDSTQIYQYTLSTPWNVSTATYFGGFAVTGQETSAQGFYIKPDGTKLYLVGGTGDDVNEYNFGTAWNITTLSYVQVFSVAAQDGSPRGLYFSSDGSKMLVVGQINDYVYQYTLNTPWNVSTAVYDNVSFYTRNQAETAPNSITFKEPDGSIMYIVGSDIDTVIQYNLG
jgi:sugar lactone lactonase YvrE